MQISKVANKMPNSPIINFTSRKQSIQKPASKISAQVLPKLKDFATRANIKLTEFLNSDLFNKIKQVLGY